jgi:NDP-sugar pyrophosphorylase family protein
MTTPINSLAQDGNYVQSNGAVVHITAKLGTGATIGAYAKIGKHVMIGSNVRVEDGANIEDDATIGDNSRIGENVRIGEKAQVGENVRIGDRSTVRDFGRIGDNAWIGEGAIDIVDGGFSDGDRRVFAQVDGVCYVGVGTQWLNLAEAYLCWQDREDCAARFRWLHWVAHEAIARGWRDQ